MKIKLEVSEERFNEIEEKLLKMGFIIDDDAQYILIERNQYSEYISCKRQDISCHIPVSEIVFIESMGHDIFVHTVNETYKSSGRLWQLEKSLNPAHFIRISNSVIIAREHVKGIKTALSQKFIVTLSNGAKVDVTRSYYYIFKSKFGI